MLWTGVYNSWAKIKNKKTHEKNYQQVEMESWTWSSPVYASKIEIKCWRLQEKVQWIVQETDQ